MHSVIIVFTLVPLLVALAVIRPLTLQGRGDKTRKTLLSHLQARGQNNRDNTGKYYPRSSELMQRFSRYNCARSGLFFTIRANNFSLMRFTAVKPLNVLKRPCC